MIKPHNQRHDARLTPKQLNNIRELLLAIPEAPRERRREIARDARAILDAAASGSDWSPGGEYRV